LKVGLMRTLKYIFLALVLATTVKAANAYSTCPDGLGELYGAQIGGKYYSYCYENGQPYTDFVQISWFRYQLWAYFDGGL
jgi:hypothetical protein